MPVLKILDGSPSDPQSPDSALDPALLNEIQLLRANANARAHALARTHAENPSTDHCCPRYFDARAHAVREPDPVVPYCHPDEWPLPRDGSSGSGANAPDISDKLWGLREPEDVLPLRRNDLFPPYPCGRAEEFERLRTRDPSQKSADGLFPRHLRPLYRRFGRVYTPPATPTQQQDPAAADDSQLVIPEHHPGSVWSLAAYSLPLVCPIPKKGSESRRPKH